MIAADGQRGPDHQAVVEVLAAFGEQAPSRPDDDLGSLELTWLISQFEERYGRAIEIDAARLAEVRTVGAATAELRRALGVPPIDRARDDRARDDRAGDDRPRATGAR